MKHASRNVLRAMLLIACSACGGDDDESGSAKLNDAELAEETNARLKECNVYLPPQNPEDDKVRDDFERCVARCVLDETSCADLLALSCDQSLEGGHPFIDCIQPCPLAPKDGFECEDGQRVAFAFVCDGNDDCKGGEDEAREQCEPYRCDDGEPIQDRDARCNSEVQCSDGSDEADCPFTCE